MKRTLYAEEHEALRESFRSWLDKEIVPHEIEWNEAGIVPRTVFSDAGSHGFLGFDVPEEFGGGGMPDFRFNTIIDEIGRASCRERV